MLTDADHKSGFKLQSMLLARLFQLVETGQIQAPLYDPATITDPNMTNSAFLKDYCKNMLKTAFPHVHVYVDFFSELYYPQILYSIAPKYRHSSTAWVNNTATLIVSSSLYETSLSNSRNSLAIMRSYSSKKRRLRHNVKRRQNAKPQCAFRVCSNHLRSRTRTKISSYNIRRSIRVVNADFDWIRFSALFLPQCPHVPVPAPSSKRRHVVRLA